MKIQHAVFRNRYVCRISLKLSDTEDFQYYEVWCCTSWTSKTSSFWYMLINNNIMLCPFTTLYIVRRPPWLHEGKTFENNLWRHNNGRKSKDMCKETAHNLPTNAVSKSLITRHNRQDNVTWWETRTQLDIFWLWWLSWKMKRKLAFTNCQW